MRFTRLISAITLVAAVTVLGSCGQSSAPTATSTTDPSAALGPREYTISPSSINWARGLVGDPVPTDTRTVLIGGIIPLASYPSFGAPVYSGGANNWLDINTTPNFSRSPLGWIVSFKLNPAAQFLPAGSYSATIPVTVPGALNNPQHIQISFGCREVVVDGPWRDGSLTGDSPVWDRYEYAYNNDPAGDNAYQDWCVFVPPNTSVAVSMQGGYPTCPAVSLGYTLYDPYLYVFTQPDHALVTYDDDTYCGYDSFLTFSNSSSSTKEYLIRSTNYYYTELGTYRLRVYTEVDLRAPDTTRAPTKPKFIPGH